jgi:hypothetical protein
MDINTNMLFWISSALAAIGGGLIVHIVFLSIFNFGSKIYEQSPSRRMKKRLQNIGLIDETKEKISFIRPAVEKLRRQAEVPLWVTILVIFIPLLGYVYTQTMIPLGLIALYILARMWLRGFNEHKEKKDMLLFLLDLRTKLTLKGSLLTALDDVAKRKHTTAAKIVGIYLNSGFQGNGLSLLKQIADDTHIPFLDNVVARAEASSAGKLSLDKALAQAIEEVQEEINVSAKEQLQKIPSRLIIIVFPLLLGPTLIVLLYPVVFRLLESMGSITPF